MRVPTQLLTPDAIRRSIDCGTIELVEHQIEILESIHPVDDYDDDEREL